MVNDLKYINMNKNHILSDLISLKIVQAYRNKMFFLFAANLNFKHVVKERKVPGGGGGGVGELWYNLAIWHEYIFPPFS